MRQNNPSPAIIHQDAIKAFALSCGTLSSVTASQVLSVPISNVMNMKYMNPNSSYLRLMQTIIQNEGAKGFYKEAYNNTVRRCITSIAPITFAKFIQDKYQISPFATATLSSALETAISYLRNETKEKFIMSRDNSSLTQANIMKSYGFIGARNFSFAGSLFFSKTLVKEFSNSVDNSFFEDKSFNRENLETCADFFVKMTLIAATTPLDAGATKIASGETIADIAKAAWSNPKTLLVGGIARTAFGAWACATILTGVHIGNSLHDQLNNKESQAPTIGR